MLSFVSIRSTEFESSPEILPWIEIWTVVEYLIPLKLVEWLWKGQGLANKSIYYHAMWESVAMGESLNSQIPTIFNLADMLTKKLFGQKKRNMVEGVLYDVFVWFVYTLCCNLDATNSLELPWGDCVNILM